ncbi:hypothetical protein OAT67_06515, partial [Bacteriovoracaceae bacterium]|nr:hypothetical protein [Bacteriovoracaceae bacterium]
MKSEYINFLLSSPKLSLSSYSTLVIEGRDSERFLNGQLTNDLKRLQDGQFQYSSRLDRAGKVISFGILKKINNESFVFISKEDLADALEADLEKFIIMDEVEVKKSNKKYDFIVSDTNVSGFLIGEPGYLEESNGNSTEKNEFFDILSFIRAEPFCILENTIGKFVNESILNNIAVSYSKGCFLGQETVAKIENNRGAAWYPMLVETNLSELENKDLFHNEQSIAKILDHKNIFGQNYFLALVKREFRIDRKSMGEYTLRHIGIIPRFENKDERVEYLYELAVETFQEGDEELSMRLLDYIIANYPHHADSYEIYGVILGRNNQYEKAISKMDKLLEVNPESVMAHTNKSLFYMKMGNIEEAEKEKSEATFKSFSQFGKDAEVKKKQEEAILKEKEEL